MRTCHNRPNRLKKFGWSKSAKQTPGIDSYFVTNNFLYLPQKKTVKEY